MGKFRSSFQLVKLAFTIINKEKELLAYSLLSAIASVLVIISYFSFILGLDVLGVFKSMGGVESQIFDITMTFLFYFLFTFVALFFNTAILTSVNRIIRGESNTFMQGIESAFSNIGGIFKWAMVSAFVSTILRIIQDKLGGWVGKLVVGILGGAWNLATFFALPIIILEKKKTKDAMKDSVQMFKKGWGDQVVTNMTAGFFFLIIFIGIAIASGGLFVLSMMTANTYIAILAGIIFVVGFAISILLSSTVSYVLQTLLYVYIKNESLPEYINLEVLGTMFKEQEKQKKL